MATAIYNDALGDADGNCGNDGSGNPNNWFQADGATPLGGLPAVTDDVQLTSSNTLTGNLTVKSADFQSGAVGTDATAVSVTAASITSEGNLDGITLNGPLAANGIVLGVAVSPVLNGNLTGDNNTINCNVNGNVTGAGNTINSRVIGNWTDTSGGTLGSGGTVAGNANLTNPSAVGAGQITGNLKMKGGTIASDGNFPTIGGKFDGHGTITMGANGSQVTFGGGGSGGRIGIGL